MCSDRDVFHTVHLPTLKQQNIIKTVYNSVILLADRRISEIKKDTFGWSEIRSLC